MSKGRKSMIETVNTVMAVAHNSPGKRPLESRINMKGSWLGFVYTLASLGTLVPPRALLNTSPPTQHQAVLRPEDRVPAASLNYVVSPGDHMQVGYMMISRLLKCLERDGISTCSIYHRKITNAGEVTLTSSGKDVISFFHFSNYKKLYLGFLFYFRFIVYCKGKKIKL